ncbi:pectinesterase family protein [Kaistella sp.]|uniref:pectinesterase family protein n=1 Tax=Kaistella sp. TaxID=2782235 RepID=UPI003C64E2D6
MFKKLLFSVTLSLGVTLVFGQQKTDVWDFGAQQLDQSLFNNKLSESSINAWYSVAAGSTNIPMPTSFSAQELSWTGGSNDRLRTSNTNLTRFDTNLGAGSAAGYTGRLYVNAGAATGRFLTLALNEDDEVSVFTNSDAAGLLNFVNVANPATQTNQISTTVTAAEYKFVAKTAGNYNIFESVSKPSYYRIQRKAAQYITFSGTVDTSQTTVIPPNYSLIFTNEAGKSWSAPINGGTYSVTLPANYTYTLSLGNANGYVLTSGESLSVNPSTTSYDIAIAQVTLYKLTGSITGLDTRINNLGLAFTVDPNSNSVFVPKPVVNKITSTYSVSLEANILYTISATGVNDDEILANTIQISPQDTTRNIEFSPKEKSAVSISTSGLSASEKNQLKLSFSNVNESGYVYNFADLNAISLRNGSYTIASSGLDAFPLELQATSYLKINNAPATKTLKFVPVNNWTFNGQSITTSTPYYKGLAFTGNIANEIAKGHLICQAGSTIMVPMNPGEKMTISYYYAANFSVNGQPQVITTSGSTSLVENYEYVYPGTSAGNAVITSAATTYISRISRSPIVAYTPSITVGSNKTYQTINDALEAVSRMARTDNERVTILVDPGNYEEMIVIKSSNITLKNASSTPSIDLTNKGVGISPNAVRITSYYGVGYNYFSQGKDNKWNENALNINKENGFTDYTNVSGTTNNSFWNATVVINANNFEAEDIIFENSFNQYISQKESADVLVMVVGNKGQRPTSLGDIAVQNKSFVERAAAIAVTNGTDKVFLKNCRVVGRQDSFYGGTNSRVAVYKGVMMGAVDYIFGSMTAVFYQTKFAMNTSDVSSDVSYLTAPQHLSGRGFLLYECTVGSAIPGTETASQYRAKPGYFGRPWAANTGETVMYKTAVETSDVPGFSGVSLISPAGWLNTLSGTSDRVYEYQTTELSGVNNSANREPWSKVLTTPFLTDTTEITPFNFTKGNDNWDPFNLATLGDTNSNSKTTVNVFISEKSVYISNVKMNTEVKVYHMNGSLAKIFITKSDTDFELPKGIYLVTVQSNDGIKSVKVLSK